ncbi:hypothetical protein N7478_010249 [Penicillium angulare]|uniref:uncharacterized protein n=1 Tax=Penicillium angulare TaxID=116970 RepID=UPI0025416FE3|nr:uncharacterized protein N7478_010041 [Penicillium angulare]XP_056775833.1 uncharacterized protein N7478_010249 [Penicillium angulare]KAJ5267233.1 hypothetical protein N7478_010041 [Penicillium angulare]KAJ5267441.1 hypothetical protein N7478_010249 [Penicillium angulare]
MDPLPNIASPRHATDPNESPSSTMMQEQPAKEIPDQQTVPDNSIPGSSRTILKQPFEDIQETLADLEISDPKLAFQAARLVGLYRRLWESCVSKQMREVQLVRENHSLREAIDHTQTEKHDLSIRAEELKIKLEAFDRAFESSRQQIMGIMDIWRQCECGDLDDVIMEAE